MPEQPSHERLHALDALRAVAMLLGIALHAMMAYMVTVWTAWAVDDPSSSPVFDAAFRIIHLFRMEVFFLIAGFFACMLIGRLTLRGFAAHRATRIAIPLVLAMLTIVPLTSLVWAWGLNLRLPAEQQRGFIEACEAFYRSRSIAGLLSPIHLWFLEHLLIMYLVAGIMHAVARRTPALTAPLEALTDAWAWIVRRGFAAIALAALAFPVILIQGSRGQDGTWIPSPGVGTQLGPIPPWQIVLYYYVFFAAGWLLYRRRHELAALGRFWITQLALGLVLAYLYIGLYGKLNAGEDVLLQARVVGSLSTGLMVVGFTGLFLAAFHAPSRIVRYISDAAYWMYIVHLPLVLLINIMLLPLDLHAFIKFSLVCLIASAVMLGSYQLFVRYTWIGVLLNGPRLRLERKRRRAESGSAVSLGGVASAEGQ